MPPASASAAARGRHAKHLERAERIDSLVGATVALWRRFERSLPGVHTHS